MLGLGEDSKHGNFMQGFIYALYEAKFQSFGKYVFTFLMLLDLTYLVVLLLVLDRYRDYCKLSPWHLIVPLLTLSILQGLSGWSDERCQYAEATSKPEKARYSVPPKLHKRKKQVQTHVPSY